MNKTEINDRLIADIQTNMVMGILEQGLVKEAENKLEEFGLTKKEINKTLNQYRKEKNNEH